MTAAHTPSPARAAFLSKKNPPIGTDTFILKLLSLRSANRTCACASTAIQTCRSVDNALAVSLRNSTYGALSHASAAADAIVIDLISHSKIPP